MRYNKKIFERYFICNIEKKMNADGINYQCILSLSKTLYPLLRTGLTQEDRT